MSSKVTLVKSCASDLDVVNAAYHNYLIEAYDRGYWVTETGRLLNPQGFERKIALYGKQRYPSFSILISGRTCSMPIHKFAAYCFYGNKAFSSVVRHLNGDVLDVSIRNIVLGTHSENNLDKPPEVRSNAAKKARAAQGARPNNAKFTDEQVASIRALVSNGAQQTYVAKLHGVTRQCINKIVRGVSYV